MSDSIFVAILSCVGTLTGTIYANKKANDLIVYRIAQLEEKVHKHNNLIERVYCIEADVKVIKEGVKNK